MATQQLERSTLNVNRGSGVGLGGAQMKLYADDQGLGQPVEGTYFYVREGLRAGETVMWDLFWQLGPGGGKL